ncbi:MAG TPA: hypothetical protein VL135_06305 [Terracidiphilus sp.]|jgi:hypothetical protein|nr:hypothetical protein [Terracidiphilus sp.]
MDNDRGAILALIAMGRISPAEAERLLAAWNESRETAWILVASLGFVLLAQLHMHEFVPIFKHLISAQIPALAKMLMPVIGGMGGLL